ncbi:MAG: universal stress protein UspA [Pelodictyon luteolum]|uniref:Universal stress protein UspA n=1 Tax=Pelodictyon luteolum TaxID=1100 RepID=A0A165L1X5_PELLU|nr:universal stress protein [Pelodictyon luteolum]KZK73469.1 MAG: universal stress protein UspA [Pelodictyon luteolum]
MIIRRIAVAIDCSPHSMASLKAARELAERLQADIQGIFVEDSNLFRLAELPFSCEIRPYNQEPRVIEPAELERAVRRQAQKAESALLAAIENSTLRHSFITRRGLVPEEVVAAALESDLLVLGRSGKSPTCRRGLGSTAQKALVEGKKPLLIMRHGISATEEPCLALYDGSEGAEKALQAALFLTPPEALLHVLILENDPEEAWRMETSIREQEPERADAMEFHHLAGEDAKTIARFIRMLDSGLVVLCDEMRMAKEDIRELVSVLDYPILLV